MSFAGVRQQAHEDLWLNPPGLALLAHPSLSAGWAFYFAIPHRKGDGPET
jgi:hypothetical protein